MRKKAPRREKWWLYVLECRTGVLYTGIAKDVEARFKMHASGKGAAFTRSNPPVRVMGKVRFLDRGRALRAEYAYKQLARADKLRWCETGLGGFVKTISRPSRAR